MFCVNCVALISISEQCCRWESLKEWFVGCNGCNLSFHLFIVCVYIFVVSFNYASLNTSVSYYCSQNINIKQGSLRYVIRMRFFVWLFFIVDKPINNPESFSALVYLSESTSLIPVPVGGLCMLFLSHPQNTHYSIFHFLNVYNLTFASLITWYDHSSIK